MFVDRQIASLAESGVESEIAGFRGTAIARHPGALFREIRTLRRQVLELAPDIVHAHWGSLLSFVTVVAAGRTPAVVTYRGSDVNPVDGERAAERYLRFALSQVSAARAATVICVSEALGRRLLLTRKPVTIIADGVDLDIFTPVNKADARRRLGWEPEETVLFFYQGGRASAKGRPLADQAVAELRARGVTCRLEVLETGEARHEVACRLGGSDCLLMLSSYEGSPNIVREAIACGIPVVSVDVGDVRRWVEPLASSYLVDRSPQAVADAVVAALKAPPDSPNLWPLSEGASRQALVALYREVVPPKRSEDRVAGRRREHA